MDTRQPEKVPVARIFSERLSELRGHRTKRDFAKEIGVLSPQTYQHYENGRVPDAEILKHIADRCGVTVDWLLGRSEVGAPVQERDREAADRKRGDQDPELYAVAELGGLRREDFEELDAAAPEGFRVQPMLIHPLSAAYEPIMMGFVSGVLANLATTRIKTLAAWLFETLGQWAKERDPSHGAGISVNGYQFSTLNAEQFRRALQERADRIQRRHAAEAVDRSPPDVAKDVHAGSVAQVSRSRELSMVKTETLEQIVAACVAAKDYQAVAFFSAELHRRKTGGGAENKDEGAKGEPGK